MADVSIYFNREVRDEGKPFEEAVELLSDAIEGFFAYKLGNPNINEQNYQAMLWAVANISGLISRQRPVYDFGYSEEQDAELTKLTHGSPYPLSTPYLR
jgi:hypothetical protein